MKARQMRNEEAKNHEEKENEGIMNLEKGINCPCDIQA